jgi:outer membrane protein OmpA-like peptidoglycan-associated protein
MSKLTFLSVSLLALGLGGAATGCKASAQVGAQPPAAPATPAPAVTAPAAPPPPAAPPVAATPPAPAAAATVEGSRVKIPGELEFDEGKATLKDSPATNDVLNTLAQFMTQNPQVTKLRIEGHTDDLGSKQVNAKLSQERADAVVAWLTAHGIDKGRLVAQGLGATAPLCKNDSDKHRALNRRTVFHVAENAGQPVAATAETVPAECSAPGGATLTSAAAKTAAPAKTTTKH